MNDQLTCIVNTCANKAAGLVCVNLHEPEITVFMIPACIKHGEIMKHANFTIELRLNEPPKVTTVPGESPTTVRPDMTLTFDSF